MVSAAETQQEGVPTRAAVQGVIFIVEVQDVFFCFEAKLLVEQHGRVAGRHVQRHVFAHARLKRKQRSTRFCWRHRATLSYLDEMVDHEGSNPSSPPLRMDQQEGDVGLVVLHIRYHEPKTNHDLLVEGDHAEVRVLQTLGEVHPCSRGHTVGTRIRRAPGCPRREAYLARSCPDTWR